MLTQYKAHSLLRHLQMGWSFLRPEMNEFLDLLPAQQRLDEATWYRGTADAVFQNFDIFRAARPEYFVVLAGDHIYKMDYSNMLADHVDKRRRLHVACVEVPIEQARDFGVMARRRLDARSSISSKSRRTRRRCPASPTARWRAWASTSSPPTFSTPSWSAITATRPRATISARTSSRTWSAAASPPRTISRTAASRRRPDAEPYWRDVGTIDAYWAANLDLVMPTPSLDIYDPNWPIWTYQQQLPPAKFVFDDDDRRGMAVNSMVSGGCIISGAHVSRSLLFSSVPGQFACPHPRGGAAARGRGRPLCAAQPRWWSTAAAASRRGW